MECFSPSLQYWPGAVDVLQGIMAKPNREPGPNHKIRKFGMERVADSLKETKEFDAAQVVLIDAPTGSGKSTFVLNTLLNDAEEHNTYILLLCNRSTLNYQNKILANKYIGGPAIGETPFHHIKVLGRLLLCSYQNILSALPYIEQIPVRTRRTPYPLRIEYVVLDEAHFFCSDATFNEKTSRILREILIKYYNCPRFYMTATMEDVKPLILYEEHTAASMRREYGNEYQRVLSLSPQRIMECQFEPDYSKIHLHFFMDWDSIKAEIRDSGSKWLIFVSESKWGKDLQKDIENSRFVDSDYVEKNQDVVTGMLMREKFQEKVLIATSVFDSGINFKDKDLKNIVVDSENLIQITQMLGRKRREQGENVELYVALNAETIINQRLSRIQQLERLLQTAAWNPDKFRTSMWGNLAPDQQKLFDIWPTGQIVINAYAYYQLALLEGKYQRIKTDFVDRHELAFAHQVCEWFGKSYTDKMLLGPVHKESVYEKAIVCLEAYTQKASQDEKNETQFLLSKNDVISLAIKLREIVKPALSLFDYTADSGETRSRLHKGQEKEHAKADVGWVLKILNLPYRLDSEKQMYRLSKIESNDELSGDSKENHPSEQTDP